MFWNFTAVLCPCSVHCSVYQASLLAFLLRCISESGWTAFEHASQRNEYCAPSIWQMPNNLRRATFLNSSSPHLCVFSIDWTYKILFKWLCLQYVVHHLETLRTFETKPIFKSVSFYISPIFWWVNSTCTVEFQIAAHKHHYHIKSSSKCLTQQII